MDNTNQLMEQIREGMDVVDSAGEKVGTVEFIKMGDPSAADLPEDAPGGEPGGLVDLLDPDQEDQITTRMLQRGYIKIDSAGLFAGDTYVLSDDIAAVEGDVVRLRERKDEIEHPA